MASRLNRYYNDPNLGAAFSNIAQMFKPPSGTEVYAHARARAAQEQAQRLSDLYSFASDPNFDKNVFDRRAVAAGRGSIASGYYGVDQNNATSRANNALDNRTRLDVAGIQERGNTTRALLAPVAQDATRFVPPALADAYGIQDTQVGVISARPGERVIAPDGRTIEGPAVPLNDAQQRAAFMRDLSPEEQRAIGFGSTPIETIQTGQGPQFVTRPQAIGQAPVPEPARQPAPVVKPYAAPDGTRGMMERDPASGRMIDTQTRREVPPGAIEIRAQASANDLGVGTTSNQTEATRLSASVASADHLVKTMRGLLQANPNIGGLVGNVRGTLQSLSSTVRQAAGAFASEAPNAVMTVQDAQALLDRIGGDYDPAIKRLQSGLFSLAYARAQMSNPSGEVSRQAFERALESFGLSRWGSQQDIETGLAAFEQDDLEAARIRVNVLRRGPSGAPRPAAPGGAAPGEFMFNPATGRLE